MDLNDLELALYMGALLILFFGSIAWIGAIISNASDTSNDVHPEHQDMIKRWGEVETEMKTLREEDEHHVER